MNRIERIFILVVAVNAIGTPADAIAQSFERIPYSAPPDWTVTTYRSSDSGAFLRCSAERHYDDGNTLTVAKNAAGKFVLGFTSDAWEFEDRATPGVNLQVDAGQSYSMPGRVRLLPSGPMLFVDIDPATTIIDELSKGGRVHVSSGGNSLTLNLRGSAAAMASANQCQRDGTTTGQEAE